MRSRPLSSHSRTSPSRRRHYVKKNILNGPSVPKLWKKTNSRSSRLRYAFSKDNCYDRSLLKLRSGEAHLSMRLRAHQCHKCVDSVWVRFQGVRSSALIRQSTSLETGQPCDICGDGGDCVYGHPFSAVERSAWPAKRSLAIAGREARYRLLAVLGIQIPSQDCHNLQDSEG